jgi:hypothetical protein
VTEKLEGRDKLIEAELDVLRAMTQGTPERAVRAEGIKILADYPFLVAVHQLIFDTLREIPADSPQVIREQLPTRLNNKGFPDLDLETVFQPHNLTARQAIALMRELRSQPGHPV